MTTEGPHNWQNPQPPLDELDRQLDEALQGPAPRADLAERIFEATADQVMAGPLADALGKAMPAAPPRGLAERIAGATREHATDGSPAHRQRSEHAGHADAASRPAILAVIGRLAVAATLLLAVGLAVHLATAPETTVDQPGPNGIAEYPALEEEFDVLEWTFATDEVLYEMAALAADLDDLSAAESEAALEDEISRQLYYYELAEAQYGSF